MWYGTISVEFGVLQQVEAERTRRCSTARLEVGLQRKKTENDENMRSSGRFVEKELKEEASCFQIPVLPAPATKNLMEASNESNNLHRVCFLAFEL